MNIGLADLRRLPLAAALVDDGGVVAATPEWRGAGVGCVSYPVRGRRLLVSVVPPDEVAGALLADLFGALSSAETTDGGALVRMVRASLQLLAGIDARTAGTSRDCLRLAASAIAARTSLGVDVTGDDDTAVTCPEVAALVLVQLAVNAERHAGATEVQLEHAGGSVHVTWQDVGRRGRAGTARRHDDRRGWGLGFARIAADALGAVVHPPFAAGGRVTSTMELRAGRLGLPLALVRRETVQRSTRAWDEETCAPPGTHIAAVPRLQALCSAARSSEGAVAAAQGWCARAVDERVWLCIPPDDAPERMLDILDGLMHERALLAGMSAEARTHVNAAALALGLCLGRPLPRVPARAWLRGMTALRPMLPDTVEVPVYEGVGAVDPALSAVLAARAGAGFEAQGDALWLRLRDGAEDDPYVRALAPRGERVRLG